MKILIALLLSLSLFACKGKNEEVVVLSQGLPGTYSKTVDLSLSEIFQDLLPNYNNFKESVTVTIIPLENNLYRMQVQMRGIATKSGDFTSFYYGFNADLTSLKPVPVGDLKTTPLQFQGNYSALRPESADLGKEKQLEAQLQWGYEAIELLLTTHYKKDSGFFLVSTKLQKTK